MQTTQPPATAPAVRLNIGAGSVPLPGFTAIDRKNGDDAYPLTLGGQAVADDSVDEIYASHVLEHFSHQESQAALCEWVRVLKPGGRIRIAVPDFAKVAEKYLAGEPLPIAGYVMGGQTDVDDYHRTIFDEEHLRRMMQQAGLIDIAPWRSEIDDCAALPISLNLQGIKGAASPQLLKPWPKRKIAAVMSMPRLAFADNMFCAIQTLAPLGIPFEKVTGAFWGQCLERVMEANVDDGWHPPSGTEWILTLDYDTVFLPEHLHQLAVLMEEHPEADAICPIQYKRDENTVLFRRVDEQGNYIKTPATLADFDGPLTRIGWGHFGLTLIRASSLLRLPHPWFDGQPDPNGRWHDPGKVDDDIYFWNKFRENGLKLYLANHVAIGHLQLVATWPGRDFAPIHQYVSEFQSKGTPAMVRR